MTTAHPLHWPEGRKRTGHYSRETARFDVTFARARDDIAREVYLLTGHSMRYPGNTNLVISTNVALRQDGLPLANQRKPDDPGVAVYFTYKGKQRCFACDRWNRIEDNMRAISKTIEAIRGISRWGTGDMLEAAFTGFTALPAPGKATSWRDVLGQVHTLDAARQAYRMAASQAHPDKGGTNEQMARVNRAWEDAQKELS